MTMIVRHTFIDVSDPSSEEESGSRLRSRSCGDEPAEDSAPITFLPSPRSKQVPATRKRTRAGKSGKSHQTPSQPGRLQQPVSAGLQPSVQPDGSAKESRAQTVRPDGSAQESRALTVRQQPNLQPRFQESSQQQQPQLQQQQQQRHYSSSQPSQQQLAAPVQRHAEQAESIEAWWLDSAEDIETVLTLASAAMSQLSCTGLVSTLHFIAKLSEADSFGNVQGTQGLLLDARFQQLVARLRELRQEVDTPRNIMRVMWALGKVGASGDDVSAIISHVSNVTPGRLSTFSSQEISNVLWGLAKQSEGKRLPESSSRLATAVITESARRIASFSSQCLTNSLWAVAKLELRGPTVENFTQLCIVNIHTAMFKEISPQGLANSLWACAKLPVDQETAVQFCVDAARRTTASQELVKLFFPQELSMALWAMARVLGRRAGRSSIAHVERFALSVAEEACTRIHDFTPQGISNIAWSLATLDLVRSPSTIRFFEAVVDVAVVEFHSYPPQAIANVCWALSRKNVPGKLLGTLGPKAAIEARTRATDFSWQDLSGIISSLMGAGLSDLDEVKAFATSLVGEASCCCSQIGTQALLNIALSAVRLKLDPQVMRPLAWGIEEVFACKWQSLNEIDQRQWNEVKRYCDGSTTGPRTKSAALCAGRIHSQTGNARNARGHQQGFRSKK